MANEDALKQKTSGKFEFLADKIRVQRERRIFAETPYERFFEVLEYLIKECHFENLCTITGLDEGENLSFIYHLAAADGTLFNLKTSVPKSNPQMKSVSSYFPSSVLYEREAVDLLGVRIEGLPEGEFRYPLPDDWPEGQHPLRKDFKPEGLDKVGKM